MNLKLTEKQYNTILDALEYGFEFGEKGTVFKRECGRLSKLLAMREQKMRSKMILTSTYGKAIQSVGHITNDSQRAP